jgi:hypothetical protein
MQNGCIVGAAFEVKKEIPLSVPECAMGSGFSFSASGALVQTVRMLFYLLLLGASFAGGTTLSVRILAEDGAPLAARVYLKSQHGDTLFPAGTLVYKKLNWNVSEEHFIAPTGAFSIELPEGAYSLTLERGKEYLPVQENIQVPAAGRTEKTYLLKRWVAMNDLGWYSADMHAHVSLNDAATLMDGEDLNVLLPVSWWRVSFVPAYRDPHLPEFLARADKSGAVRTAKNRWFTPLNEELESDQSSILISRLGSSPLELEFPFELMAELAHNRGALVDSEKPTSAELPAIAALGGVDFLGLANNHFWRSACYTGPWGVWPDHALQAYAQTCEGFARAGFDLYYALLNTGVRAELSAGSAYGVQPTPLGWSRVYVHVGSDFSPENWFKALAMGRSFVTTGSMIFLTVNGLEPGEVHKAEAFPLSADVELKVLSTQPAKSAEVVVNGKARSIPLAPDSSNPFSFSGATTLRLESSSWLAARYIAVRGQAIDIAHTSPIFLCNRDQPLPVAATDAEYVLRRIDNLISEVKAGRAANGSDSTSNIFDNSEVRRRTLQYLEQAREHVDREAYRGCPLLALH